jgi:hypothetical protein
MQLFLILELLTRLKCLLVLMLISLIESSQPPADLIKVHKTVNSLDSMKIYFKLFE